MSGLDLNKVSNIKREFADSVYMTINLINKYSEDDKQEKYQTIKDIAKGFISTTEEFQKCFEALEKTKNFFDNSEDKDVDVHEVYENNLEEYESDFENNKLWKEICALTSAINEKSDMNKSCRNLSIVRIEKEEIHCDPLTKKPIQKRCKNTKCGHVYDYNSISLYIKTRKKSVRCPYIGCTNLSFSIKHIEVDEEED